MWNLKYIAGISVYLFLPSVMQPMTGQATSNKYGCQKSNYNRLLAPTVFFGGWGLRGQVVYITSMLRARICYDQHWSMH
jgi:hypothetical protein